MAPVKLSVLIILLWQTSFDLCIGAEISEQSSRADSLRSGFLNLQQAILNPHLENKSDVRQWAWNYENLRHELLTAESEIIATDSIYARLMNEVIPKIIYAVDPLLKKKLYIIFEDGVENILPVVTALEKYYTKAATFFKENLRLVPPRGLIFIMVKKDGNHKSSQEYFARVVHGGSRFLVIDEAWFMKQNRAKVQIERILLHTFYHLLINDIIDQRDHATLPNWFQEMVIFTIVGNRQADFQNDNLALKLPTDFVLKYHVGRHLERAKGRHTFYQLVRRSLLRGRPEIHLLKLYGYSSFEAVLPEAMSLSGRCGRWLEDILHIRSRLVRNTGLQVFFIALIIIFATGFLNQRSWFLKLCLEIGLWSKYKIAIRLMNKNQLEAALDKFNEFVVETGLFPTSESGFLNWQTKPETARQHQNNIQNELYKRLTNDIETSFGETAETCSIERAETVCFKLERLWTKFDQNYALRAQKYLQEKAPVLVKLAWVNRKNNFKNIKQADEIIPALQFCLDYAGRHQDSSYFPHRVVNDQIKVLLRRWEKLFDNPQNRFQACDSYRAVQKLVAVCKAEEPYKTTLETICGQFQVHCLIEQIITKSQAGKWLKALQQLSDLYPHLTANYRTPQLIRQILDCFDEILSEPGAEKSAEKQYPSSSMILELQKKHLQQLTEICSGFSDDELAGRYRERLQKASTPKEKHQQTIIR